MKRQILFSLLLSSWVMAAIVPVAPMPQGRIDADSLLFRLQVLPGPTSAMMEGRLEVRWDGRRVFAQMEWEGTQLRLRPDLRGIPAGTVPGDHLLEISDPASGDRLSLPVTLYRGAGNASAQSVSSSSSVVETGSAGPMPPESIGKIRLIYPWEGETVSGPFWLVVSIPPSAVLEAMLDSAKLSVREIAPGVVGVLPDGSVTSMEGEHELLLRLSMPDGTVEERMVSFLGGKAQTERVAGRAGEPAVAGISGFESSGSIRLLHAWNDAGDTSWYQAQAEVSGNGRWQNGAWYDYEGLLANEDTRHMQSDDRLSLHLGYRNWLQLSLGDLYPQYSPLVLQGERIRGMGVMLKTPGEAVGMDVVYGWNARAVDPWLRDPAGLDSLGDSLGLDSLVHDDTVAYTEPGTYERKMVAGRFTVGSGRFAQWGLSILKAEDDTGSIRQTYLDGSGEPVYMGLAPVDQIVTGTDLRMRFFSGRWQIQGSVALSVYTEDSRGGIGSLGEDLDPDVVDWLERLQDYIIINSGTTPKPVDADGSFTSDNLDGSLAWDAGTVLDLGPGAWRSRSSLRFQYTGSNYRTLGNPWLVRDRAGWEAEERLDIGSMYLRTGWREYWDNLTEAKPYTTSYRYLSGEAGILPKGIRPGVQLDYSGSFLNPDKVGAADSSFSDTLASVYGSASHSAGASVQEQLQFGRLVQEWRIGTRLNSYHADHSESADASLSMDAQLEQSLQGNPWYVRIGYGHGVLVDGSGLEYASPSIGVGYKGTGIPVSADLAYAVQNYLGSSTYEAPATQQAVRAQARWQPESQHILQGRADFQTSQDASTYRFQIDYEYRY